MNAHRQGATITKDPTLLLNNLPFGVGQTVEVIVFAADENLLAPVAGNGGNGDGSHGEVWSDASHKALQEIWDNPEDAAYDNA